jgi:hypothetical protein
MRSLLLPLLLLLTACGGGGDDAGGNAVDPAFLNRIEDLSVLEKNEAEAAPGPSFPLEPVSFEDVARELAPGAGCDLMADGRFLFVAVGQDAIARVRGKIVHLKPQGPLADTGGYFTGEGLSVSIGRVSPDSVSADGTARWPAEIAVRQKADEKPQTRSATWRCGA